MWDPHCIVGSCVWIVENIINAALSNFNIILICGFLCLDCGGMNPQNGVSRLWWRGGDSS